MKTIEEVHQERAGMRFDVDQAKAVGVTMIPVHVAALSRLLTSHERLRAGMEALTADTLPPKWKECVEKAIPQAHQKFMDQHAAMKKALRAIADHETHCNSYNHDDCLEAIHAIARDALKEVEES